MDVLSIVCALFGLSFLSLSAYHWHLGARRQVCARAPRHARDERAVEARHGASGGMATESRGIATASDAPARPRQRSGIFPRAVLHDPSAAGPDTHAARAAGEAAAPEHRQAPVGLGQRGVYTTAEASASRPEQRGRRTAERLLSDTRAARTRRGRNAALDVIVIGASREGVAATLRLLDAGLRVLLVDAASGEGLDAARLVVDPSLSAALHALQRERLPIVWGHRVLAIGARPDGMLELSAERAAWYTANVIVAAPAAWRRERAA